MPNTKISALPAAAVLTGAEKISSVQAGGNVAVTPAQIAAYNALVSSAGRRAAIAAGKTPRIAFFGDSINAANGAFNINSPMFWAQVRNPRLYAFNNIPGSATRTGDNLAVSGSKSGDLTNGSGGSLWVAATAYAANAPDMNTAIIKDRLAAIRPDILFCIGPTNDQIANVGLNDSFLNVKAVMEAADPAYFLFMPTLPRNAVPSSYVFQMQALMKRWEMDDPRVRCLEAWDTFVDDTSTFFPIGAAGGDAGDLTYDGLHPGPLGARRLAPVFEAALDDIGVRRTSYRAVSQSGIYNAATNPYGNLLGTRGAMGGTGGTLGANASGTVATGWTLSTANAEVTVAGTANDSITVTDATGATRTHTAQKYDITAAAPLTAIRSVTLATSSGGWVGPAAAHELIVSALARITNLVGCIGIQLIISGTFEGGARSYSIGNSQNGTVAAAEVPATIDELLKLVVPGTCQFDSGSVTSMSLILYFRSGTAAGALGTVRVAQVNASRVPPTLPAVP